jgi:hypothetical protein
LRVMRGSAPAQYGERCPFWYVLAEEVLLSASTYGKNASDGALPRSPF